MGNRLSKLATKTGDDGTTGISGNQRLAKDSHRIEAIGVVDELNATIGMVLSQPIAESLSIPLSQIQHHLFDLGGELAMPEYKLVEEKHLLELENWLDTYNQELPPLKEFVLPKGDLATTCCHLARTVCRRAERRLVTLINSKTTSNSPVNPMLSIYLNRLSDLLFVFCRMLARNINDTEEMWDSKRI